VALLVHMAFRLRVRGEGAIPTTGAAIVAANHVSLVDPVAIALVVSKRGRVIRFVTAAEFFDKPFVGWVLHRYGQIAIRRGAADRRALARTAEIVRRGNLAGIFPEGRVRGPEEPAVAPHTGVARIAIAAGVPVLPVGVWGGQVRWPAAGPRLGSPLRPPLAVSVGAPIAPHDSASGRDAARALTERIMAGVAAMESMARDMTAR
jgi:1-acyl-sn-glycerol-3-phosphate acyltransferase